MKRTNSQTATKLKNGLKPKKERTTSAGEISPQTWKAIEKQTIDLISSPRLAVLAPPDVFSSSAAGKGMRQKTFSSLFSFNYTLLLSSPLDSTFESFLFFPSSCCMSIPSSCCCCCFFFSPSPPTIWSRALNVTNKFRSYCELGRIFA